MVTIRQSNMKWLYTGLRAIQRAAVIFLALLSFVNTMLAQEVLTNEKIVAMTKAHLGDKVIIGMIQENAGKYVVTSNALIALKQQGVSDEAITAMRAKMAEKADVPITNRQLAPPSEWQPGVQRDKMTGEPTLNTSRLMPPEKEGQVQVTAFCGNANEIKNLNSIPDLLSTFLNKGLGLPEDLSKVNRRGPAVDTRFLSFRFTFAPRDAHVVLRRTQVAQRVHTDASGTGTVSPPRFCAFLRVMVDDHGREGQESDLVKRM